LKSNHFESAQKILAGKLMMKRLGECCPETFDASGSIRGGLGSVAISCKNGSWRITVKSAQGKDWKIVRGDKID